jgi:hypothetical protein
VIIGPIPTVLRFFLSPLYRVEVFITDEILASFKKDKKKTEGGAEGAGDDDSTPPPSPVSTAHLAVKSGDDDTGPRRGLRRRPKPQTQAQDDQALLGRGGPRGIPLPGGQAAGNGGGGGGDDDDDEGAEGENQPRPPVQQQGVPAFILAEMPTDLRSLIARKVPRDKQNLMRSEAARILKSDYLLTLTKPVIPLLMLVATGQVFNGLISSLAVGHVLRNWVPDIKAEWLHVFLVVFGALHTLLGSSAEMHAAQMENAAQTDMGDSMLRLQVCRVLPCLGCLGCLVEFLALACFCRVPSFLTISSFSCCLFVQL